MALLQWSLAWRLTVNCSPATRFCVIIAHCMLYDDVEALKSVALVCTTKNAWTAQTEPAAGARNAIVASSAPVTAGLAIYDTMQFITCDVATYCIGQAASMGAVLLTAGTAGKRFALPNARIMIHQPLAGMQGTAAEIEIHAREFRRIKARMNEILIKHTGQSLDKIEQDTDRDCFMTADEACEYKLIDKVIAAMENVK